MWFPRDFFCRFIKMAFYFVGKVSQKILNLGEETYLSQKRRNVFLVGLKKAAFYFVGKNNLFLVG